MQQKEPDIKIFRPNFGDVTSTKMSTKKVEHVLKNVKK